MKTFLKLVALTFLAGSFIFLSTSTAIGSDDKIAAEVYQELEYSNDGYVYVIVMLEPVPLLPKDRMAEQQDAVYQRQDRVLTRISPGDFIASYRYKNFAAMTGLVNAQGLVTFEIDPEVLSVGLDARVVGYLEDSVPFIEADLVQNSGFTGQGITVAVLDSGIDTDHPDLSDNIAAGAWHFLYHGTDQGPGAEDDHGHGTNVSGIITSAGTVSSVGVAPDADILAVKVLDSDNQGGLTDWVAGVDYVVSVVNDYDNLCAINMSFGSNTLYSDCPCDNSTTNNQLAQVAILAARNVGIITFAASGNSGSTTSMGSPACLSSTVAVAAVYDQDLGREPDSGTYGSGCFDDPTYGDLITCFSNRSGCNDLAAPGRSIAAPGMGGGTSTMTGTSQASPHSAGVAALMCQRADDLGMTLSPDDILQALRDTGHPTDDPAGTTPNPIRIDAFDAVASLNEAPEAVCQDVQVDADGDCLGIVTADMVDDGSFDPDGDPITLALDPAGPYDLGTTNVTLIVTDETGASDSCDAVVTCCQ
jgi:subtilisin family serine protease